MSKIEPPKNKQFNIKKIVKSFTIEINPVDNKNKSSSSD